MKPFLAEKRRMIEIGVLLVLDLILYFFVSDLAYVSLFSFGFIWNWTASQDLTSLLSNHRYRFSMVKFVNNIQDIILRPVQKFPRWTHIVVRSLPAGIFWLMVILINNSIMPWWMTFAGSLVFEIVQLEIGLLKKSQANQDLPPPPPSPEGMV